MQVGERIGASSGKVVASRVLPDLGHGPRVETTFQASTQLLGIDGKEFGTYESYMRPDGNLYGEGRGVLMGKNGESVSWQGHGIGKRRGSGSSWRATLVFQTKDSSLARLNETICIAQFDVDDDGNTKAQIFEVR